MAVALATPFYLDMGFSRTEIGTIAKFSALSIFSASQDIVLDAYRRELLADDELGTGTSIFVNAYRISSLIPGSLALILSDLIQTRSRNF